MLVHVGLSQSQIWTFVDCLGANSTSLITNMVPHSVVRKALGTWIPGYFFGEKGDAMIKALWVSLKIL